MQTDRKQTTYRISKQAIKEEKNLPWQLKAVKIKVKSVKTDKCFTWSEAANTKEAENPLAQAKSSHLQDLTYWPFQNSF